MDLPFLKVVLFRVLGTIFTNHYYLSYDNNNFEI